MVCADKRRSSAISKLIDRRVSARYRKGVELAVPIPEEIAERLGDGVTGDLSRRALEALLAEECPLGRLRLAMRSMASLMLTMSMRPTQWTILSANEKA